jgi:predicted NAD/FAD-dependent oxidoreductase
MTLCEQVLYHAHGGDEKGITTTRQGAQGEALCSAPARCPPRMSTPLRMRMVSRLEALLRGHSTRSVGEDPAARGAAPGDRILLLTPVPQEHSLYFYI